MEHNTEFLHQLRLIFKLHECCLQGTCDAFNLSRTEVEVIAFLGNNPGMDTARDIVELRRIPKANVSIAVEALLQKGLLEKQGDMRDRRLIHLKLTPAAIPVLNRAREAQKAMTAQLFAGFSEEERREYARLNQKIFQNAKVGLE